MALQTSPATCRHPGVTGLYPGPPEKGGLGLGPTRNQTRTELESEICQEEMISLLSSAQAEALLPASRTRGLEKQGRIGRAKERKERGKGREVNKGSCSLPVGALWPVVHIRRKPGTKSPNCSHWFWSLGRQAGP